MLQLTLTPIKTLASKLLAFSSQALDSLKEEVSSETTMQATANKQPAPTVTVARKRGRRRQQIIPDKPNGLDRVFIWDIDSSLVRGDTLAESREPTVLASVSDKLSILSKRLRDVTLSFCDAHLFLNELEMSDQMHIDDVPSEDCAKKIDVNNNNNATDIKTINTDLSVTICSKNQPDQGDLTTGNTNNKALANDTHGNNNLLNSIDFKPDVDQLQVNISAPVSDNNNSSNDTLASSNCGYDDRILHLHQQDTSRPTQVRQHEDTSEMSDCDSIYQRDTNSSQMVSTFHQPCNFVQPNQQFLVQPQQQQPQQDHNLELQQQLTQGHIQHQESTHLDQNQQQLTSADVNTQHHHESHQSIYEDMFQSQQQHHQHSFQTTDSIQPNLYYGAPSLSLQVPAQTLTPVSSQQSVLVHQDDRSIGNNYLFEHDQTANFYHQFPVHHSSDHISNHPSNEHNIRGLSYTQLHNEPIDGYGVYGNSGVVNTNQKETFHQMTSGMTDYASDALYWVEAQHQADQQNSVNNHHSGHLQMATGYVGNYSIHNPDHHHHQNHHHHHLQQTTDHQHNQHHLQHLHPQSQHQSHLCQPLSHGQTIEHHHNGSMGGQVMILQEQNHQSDNNQQRIASHHHGQQSQYCDNYQISQAQIPLEQVGQLNQNNNHDNQHLQHHHHHHIYQQQDHNHQQQICKQQQINHQNQNQRPDSNTVTTLRTVLNNHHKQMTQRLSIRFHRIRAVYHSNKNSLKDDDSIGCDLNEILSEIDHYTCDWRKRSMDCLRLISESPNCTNIIITKFPLIIALGHLICLGLAQFFDVDQVYSANKTNKEACIKRIRKRFGATNRCSYIIVGGKEDVELAKKLDLPSWTTSRGEGHEQLIQLYTALKEGYLM